MPWPTKKSTSSASSGWPTSRRKSTTPEERQDKSNQTRLSNLQAQGLLPGFLKYAEGPSPVVRGALNAGSGIFDVLNRSEYATAGAAQELLEGNPSGMLPRVRRELFSGLDGQKGDKVSNPDVVRQAFPGYAKFSEEHPVLSIGSDLAMSILGDPTTFIGTGLVGKAGKADDVVKAVAKSGKKTAGEKFGEAIGKNIIGPVVNSKKYKDIAGTLGRAFDTRYLWKKGGEKVGDVNRGLAGYDIMYAEQKLSDAVKRTDYKKIQPVIDDISAMNKAQKENYLRVMKRGDAPLDDAVARAATTSRELLDNLRVREVEVLKKDPAWGMEHYFPNDMKAINELLSETGDYVRTGHGRALLDQKDVFEKAQKLRDPDELLTFLYEKGMDEEGLTDFITLNLGGRINKSANRIRTIRTHTRWTEELPDVFRKVENGVRTPWNTSIKPGEAPWMPKGNLRFFSQSVADMLPAAVRDALDAGGKMTDDIRKQVDEAIDAATKTVVNVTEKGEVQSVGPLKKLEDVVKGALVARGMPDGEAMAYINKIRVGAAANGATRVVENVTKVDRDFLADYITGLVKQAGGSGVSITPALREKLNRTVMGVTTKVPVYAVPSEIVEDIGRVSKNLANEHKLLGWYDQVLNVWKNSAVFSVFFHTRNAGSSAAINYIADVNPMRYGDALGVMVAKDMNKVVKGRTVAQWRKMMEDSGIFGGSFIGQQARKTSIPFVDTAFQANRWVGSQIESAMRGTMFMDRMLKGKTAKEAMLDVKKFHFDYNELTDFEQTFMRRGMPFYSWMRFNVPLQMEMVMKAPKKYRNIAKFKQSIAGDNRAEQTPDWWKSQDVWVTKFDDDQGSPMGIMAGLPVNDLNIGNLADNPAGAMGPYGAIGNIMRNYDPFFKKEIREFPGQQSTVLTMGDREIKMPAKMAYAVQNLSPIAKRYGTDMSKEISDILAGKASTASKYKLLSRFIGVRLLPVMKDQVERQQIYKLRRELEDFSKYQRQQGGDE